MHRILLSAAMIVLAGGLVAGGTGAFFSDEETSTGNVFAAGAIDLKIDNTSYGFDWNRPNATNTTGAWGQNDANSWQLDDLTDQLFFDFYDLKPGDYGEDTISLHVLDNDAYACMAFDLTATPENGQNEPEALVDATAGDDEGELQNYLSFLFWYDDGDNVLEDGEVTIPELSGLPGSIFTGGWLPIAEGGDDPLPGDSTVYIGKGWCFGEITEDPVDRSLDDNTPPEPGATGFTCNGVGDHNDAQTDGINVDVAFHAVQSRHNEQFSCSSLPPLGGGGGLGCTENADVMFVLDSSGSIDPDELDVVKNAASSFAAALNPSTPGTHIGVVDFDSSATLEEHLTDVLAAIDAAIANLASGGLTNLADGILTASTELENPGDGHDRPDAGSPDYMVIITDGIPNSEIDATAAADAAKAAGTTIYVVGVGNGVNEAYLETIASTPNHYFSSAEFGDLEAILGDIADCDLALVAPQP